MKVKKSLFFFCCKQEERPPAGEIEWNFLLGGKGRSPFGCVPSVFCHRQKWLKV